MKPMTPSALPSFQPLIEAWTNEARLRTAQSVGSGQPWWVSPTAQVESIAETARAIHWYADVPESSEETWGDVYLTRGGITYALRSVASLHSLSECPSADIARLPAARVVQTEQEGGRDTAGQIPVQWLWLAPFARTEDGDDEAVRRLMHHWQANGQWNVESLIWIDASHPMHRNASGWAFPGFALLL